MYTLRVKPVRLLLADDTEMIRRAVRRVIEETCDGVQVVGEERRRNCRELRCAE